jgi:S1-C subfamily serine protease
MFIYPPGDTVFARVKPSQERTMENLKESSDLLAALSDGMADAVEKIGASVVRVNGRRRRPASGVIYASNMVLTASHVLEREEDLTVGVSDGRTLPAQFVGRDPSTDLAVLRAESLDGVEVAAPAEGSARIGQLALAVGSPGRGEGPRASLGVVGSVGGSMRTWRGARLERYIQTDATPYPGFSGGPLIDARGNVLGIMTTGLARGAALAIPSELAWRVARTLEERGSVKRGYLGILSQPVRLPDTQRLGLTQRGGLLVVGVEEDSPAGRGGLIIGDILATFNGQPVEDTEDLLALLTGERVGRRVPVKVIRGGELQTLQVTVGERG